MSGAKAADRLIVSARPGAASRRRDAMPRYLIERHFPEGLGLAPDQPGRQTAATVIANNAQQGVTWVHSYVTPDKRHTFCIFDAPSPEAIRKAADHNGLPAERITEVRVLDPSFHL
jgi:hypothetical protein